MNTFALTMLVLGTIAKARAGSQARTRASDISVMAMNTHMDATVKREMVPHHQSPANAILVALQRVIEKIRRRERVQWSTDLGNFKPELHAADAHFTNNAYALEAWFDPFDPASDVADVSLHELRRVLEAMHMAAASASQAPLDADVPLSAG